MLLLIIVFALLLVVGLQLVRGLLFRGMGGWGWGRPLWGGWHRPWGWGPGWRGYGMRGYSWPPDGPRGPRYACPRGGFDGLGGPDGRGGPGAHGMRP
jgi:hypothetical protein